jgi:hypothetical protein
VAHVAPVDVERRIGAVNFARLCDDDGDGVADPAIVAEVLEEASRIAEGILLRAFSLSTIAKLAASDIALRGAICDVAIGLAGRRRPELLGPTGNPYTEMRKDGERVLFNMTKAEQRIAAEEQHGVNGTIGGGISVGLPAKHVFAPSRTNPRGSGGF